MNQSTTTIRFAASNDSPAITQIYSENVLHGTGTFETEPPDETEIARRFQAISDRGLPWFVAERGGELVGYAYAGPFRSRPAYDWLVEDSIYLRRDCHGCGIGTLLLNALLDRCTTLGYRQMLALIGDSANKASIRLHEKMNFRHIGVMPSAGWKHGRWLDVVMMQRSLGVGDQRPADERPEGLRPN